MVSGTLRLDRSASGAISKANFPTITTSEYHKRVQPSQAQPWHSPQASPRLRWQLQVSARRRLAPAHMLLSNWLANKRTADGASIAPRI
jgi:hypothetical protein